MVSGGLSVGYGIRETAIKEAAEEASIPESLAQKIVSRSMFRYLITTCAYLGFSWVRKLLF